LPPGALTRLKKGYELPGDQAWIKNFQRSDSEESHDPHIYNREASSLFGFMSTASPLR